MSLRERFDIPMSADTFRLHFVHGGFEFPIRVYRHDRKVFTVVETDGGAVEPVEVNEIIVGIGETFVVDVPVMVFLND